MPPSSASSRPRPTPGRPWRGCAPTRPSPARPRLAIEFATIRAEMDGPPRHPAAARRQFRAPGGECRHGDHHPHRPGAGAVLRPERELRTSAPPCPKTRKARPKARRCAPARPCRRGAGRGRLTFIDSNVDYQTRHHRAQGPLRQCRRRLWPGQYVRITLVPRIEPDTISVPAASLQVGQQGALPSSVQDEGHARRRRSSWCASMAAAPWCAASCGAASG